MKSSPRQNRLRHVRLIQITVKKPCGQKVRGVEVTSSKVDVIEDHPIALAHSEVDAVELGVRKGDILQVASCNQRA